MNFNVAIVILNVVEVSLTTPQCIFVSPNTSKPPTGPGVGVFTGPKFNYNFVVNKIGIMV